MGDNAELYAKMGAMNKMGGYLARNDDLVMARPKTGLCHVCGTSERYAGGQCVKCTRDYVMSCETDEQKQRRMDYQRSDAGRANSRANIARRRTRKTNAGGSFGAGEFKELCRHYDCHCLRCGKQFPIIKLEADHVIAVANGGSSDIENIQPLCRSCNSSKGAKNTDYRDKVEWDKFGKPVFWWQAGLQI